ncbi:2-oxo-4-hydroxy-4-carboxy-5-ureidoimidazoline decarboxylase [Spirillospora sp. CA-294931]|uniref:2-oxo-4-hydroxy-4-carboxy-5-ureidoimidazoline decarboxylase n=1 Tax=Spirillospora sp. CA-294931 TaxID=3240042 RepID=UPI003D8A92BE
MTALDRFNGLPPAEAEAELLACCASGRWVTGMAAGRPYPDAATLRLMGAAELHRLGWDGVLEALAAHPRIGERVAGEDRESAWSRQEQSGMDRAAAGLRDALVEGNLAYEARFGHVYLVCATGLSAEEMLDRLHSRLRNTPDAERDVVRAELGRIVALRLTRLAAGDGGAA